MPTECVGHCQLDDLRACGAATTASPPKYADRKRGPLKSRERLRKFGAASPPRARESGKLSTRARNPYSRIFALTRPCTNDRPCRKSDTQGHDALETARRAPGISSAGELVREAGVSRRDYQLPR